jgi:hypothetical protein
VSPRLNQIVSTASGRTLAIVIAVAGSVMTASCHGSGGATGGAVAVPLCATTNLGAAPLRRLTRFEYGRTLHDLLGADPSVASQLPPDEETLGFDDIATAYSVSALHTMSYLEVAEAQAASLVGQPQRLTAFAGCDPTGGDGACVDAFIAGFGRQAWRRPLDPDEAQAMRQLYDDTSDTGPADGLSAVVAAMLQAPQFLYRPEPPAAGAPPLQPLDGHALATRLAYLLWGSGPDQALLDAADAGKLDTDDGLTAEADRLLADDRSAELFAHFSSEWWELETLPGLDKDRSLYRTWTDGTPAALGEETQAFLTAAWHGSPTVAALVTAPSTFVDADLAAYYGLPAPAGDGFQKVALDPTRAAGMLTQGSFLATHADPDQTSPVLRGKFVRARLFCTPPSPPPPDIVIRPPAVDPRLSTRQRFAQHVADPTCSGCHNFMDPIGFGFEHFDAAGRWRDVDGGQPVDATGMLTGTDVDGAFDGVADLASHLARSAEVRDCVATQWFRYAFGRSEVTPGDLCTIGALSTALGGPGGDVKALVRATVRMPAFRTLTPAEAQP